MTDISHTNQNRTPSYSLRLWMASKSKSASDTLMEWKNCTMKRGRCWYSMPVCDFLFVFV